MTEPTPTEPEPLITPEDLAPFATIPKAKADVMIEDALGMAEVHAPCINDPGFAHRRAAKAILRGAILRWHEAGAGAAVTKNAGIYGQTVDTRQPRKAMFFPSEIDQLRKLCRPDDDNGGAFSIDLLPQESVTHAEICSIYFGGGCSCGAILTRGLPLYEKNNGWA
ncbi:head-to-tail adaptor [Mycobacterium phage Paito]|uniref:Head-to-tail adaptor n=1 Tax=Mycobacterium phage Paito TaxID=2315544 RepID=A0A386KHG7_9CAUD|nr:head-tail adaptor [Mycobacterium phage Paito]AYD84594.1 head-to-tail adaptor [Mycobacterium phage Paito]